MKKHGKMADAPAGKNPSDHPADDGKKERNLPGLLFACGAVLISVSLICDISFQKTVFGKKIYGLLNPGRFILETVPPGAAVSIMSGGRNILKSGAVTPLTVEKILPGSYSLVLEKEGLEPVTGTLTVHDRKNALLETADYRLNISGSALIPFGICFYVDSVPAGASLCIDGLLLPSKLPLKVNVPAGERVLEAFFARGGPARIKKKVNIIPGKDYNDPYLKIKYFEEEGITRAKLELVFRADFSICSKPQGASVYIDGSGSSIGVTPVECASITPGNHRLNLKRYGFRNWEKEINVSGREQVKINAVLKKNVKFGSCLGSSCLGSSPGTDINAQVEIEGTKIKRRKTPFSCLLDDGTYSVKFRKKGYEDVAAEVEAAETEEINACFSEYREKYATLIVDTRPGFTGAKIFVDGKPAGDTVRKIGDLEMGGHTVTVKHPGLSGPASKEIEFCPGRKTILLKIDAAGNLYEENFTQK